MSAPAAWLQALPLDRIDWAGIWTKVDISVTGCWLWTGALEVDGYARRGQRIDGKYRKLAIHRLMYRRYVGSIPDDLTLDHLCRVRHCVNPAHLEPVTHRENIRRGEGRAAVNAAKTHCIRGHEFTPENTVPRSGGRGCRTCKRIYERELCRRNG